ncbi:MACPF domain-containing protein [Serratia proteamaculans]|uniref:MACPF domain-containing protein n=1 Tax=Serratia proteamaculans TaxID=28151 RepID=UPI00217BB516|nr:MACPF domain-containing protein [Serratia proteamaculans]CAI1634379.1 MAC/Perforin domain [Serratia proteamaculans]
MKIESSKVEGLFSSSFTRINAVPLPSDALPGVGIIGCGYNPFLAYADASAVLHPILDWSKSQFQEITMNGQQYQLPDVLQAVWLSNQSYASVTGKSLQSYLTELANSIKVSGNYGFFSASATNEFTDSSLRKSENEFSRCQQSFDLWSISVPADILRLQNYVSDDFRKLINAINPANQDSLANVFNVYGSHVLMSGVMGGKAHVSASANKLTLTQKFEMSTIVQAKYEQLTSQLSVEDKLKYSEAFDSFSESGTYTYDILGGSPSLGALVFKTNSQGSSDDNLKNWIQSIASMPVLTKFIDQTSLMPVWLLCEDQIKADALKKHYDDTWSKSQMAVASLRSNYIDEVTFVLGDNSDIPAPVGYTKVPVDLNSDAGGKYIYLCYHEAQFTPVNAKQPIVDIQVLYGSQMPAPGYKKIDVDLNSGAGGEFVYLSYKKGDPTSSNVINKITAVYGKNEYVPTPYGYKQIHSDLNAGAGGNFVYFCTYRGGTE